MNPSINNLLRIADSLKDQYPLLAYDLASNIRNIISVPNPEAERIEQKIERIIGVLKSMRQEINKALTDHETAEEFAKWFKDGLPEEDELRRLVSSSRVALPWFKKKDKKGPDEDSSGISPSYKISPDDEESFLRGEDSLEPGKFIEKEKKQKDEFLSSVEDVTKMFDKAKNGRADKGVLKILLKAVDNLIANGSKMISGWRGTPKKPVNLKKDVEHFTKLLQQNMDDEAKMKKVLADFFRAVKPSLG